MTTDVKPLRTPAIAIGDQGINLIKKPPVLQIIPVISKSRIAELRLKLCPL
tara:strand:- start:779 stop:931 length:153 start_codon:yes stop_codon:yes gene_type:complete